MASDKPVFAEIVDTERSFTNNLILAMNTSMNNSTSIVRSIVLFTTYNSIIESSRIYTAHNETYYKRNLKCDQGYLYFSDRTDYDLYILYKKLVKTFLENNPEYNMVGTEFSINRYCCSTDVVFEFIYEPNFV